MRLLIVLSLLLFVTACGPSLQSMSAGQVGCKAGDVRISDESSGLGERTWTAHCNDEAFSCSQVNVGAFSTGTSYTNVTQVSCSRMGGTSGGYASASRAGGSSQAPTARQAPKGSVERKYDEKRELHVVRGSFKLATGIDMHMVGAPQVNLGTVAVVLAGSHWSGALTKCPKLEVLVNEQPFVTEQNTAKDLKGNRFNIESRFEFGVFKPLAQQFSTFGVRACGEAWKLNEQQVIELKKFLVIYSQIGIQVQNGELPSKEGQELGSPQGEDVPASSEQPAAPAPRDGV
jgi:hypothetical protein